VDSLVKSLLDELYGDYLVDQDAAAFIHKVTQRYTSATLERLAQAPRRTTRRAATLALGFVGGYESNAALGRALCDEDRLVRGLAENGIRSLWLRAGGERERERLRVLVRLNASQQYKEALRQATELITEAPDLAEAWNQRAVACYCLGRYLESIRDCRQTLKLNPYHFGAAGGLGQCYVQLGEMRSALEHFRHALALNPSLEGVRASVTYLERSLKRH
jgi:tetratricopeptide (TPR) repeat protein